MARTTGPNCALMCNLVHARTRTQTSSDGSSYAKSEIEIDPAPQHSARPLFIHFLSNAKKNSFMSIRAIGLLVRPEIHHQARGVIIRTA